MRHRLRFGSGRGIGGMLALLLALALGVGGVAGKQATNTGASPLADLGYPELTVTTDGTTLTVPAEVEAGRYRLIFENGGELGAEISIFQLPEGATLDDLSAAFEEAATSDGPPALFFDLVFYGGISAGAGGTGDVVLDLLPGEQIFNATFTNEETGEETDLIEVVTITGESPAIEEPTVVAEAVMSEFAFALTPDPVPAGPGVWKLTNVGDQLHHLVLFQVPDGTTEDQIVELIAGLFGPPPGPDATPMEGALSIEDLGEVFGSSIVSPGQTNWIGLDLAPGTYAGVCFLPTPDGAPHVMLGMVQVFTVA